jgi:DNA-binding beta-propeller fold protein YncE
LRLIHLLTAILIAIITVSLISTYFTSTPKFEKTGKEPSLDWGTILEGYPDITTSPPQLLISNGLTFALHNATGHTIAYLSNPTARKLYILDATTGEYLGKILFNKAATGPISAAYSKKVDRIIILRGSNGNDLLIVRPVDFSLEKQIPVSRGNGLILSEDGSTAYVYANSGFDGGVLYVIDLVKAEVIRKIESSRRLGFAALSPDGESLYYTHDDGVSKIDLTSGEETFVERFQYPQTLEFNPVDSSLYLPYKRRFELEYADLLILKPQSVAELVHNVTHFIHSMSVTPDGSSLFCVDWIDGNVKVVDTRTLAVSVFTPDVVSYGFRVFFSSDSSYAYFVFPGHSSNMEQQWTSPCFVEVVSVESGATVKVIHLDDSPMGVSGDLTFSK